MPKCPKCSACKKVTQLRTDGAECHKCRLVFHRACVGLPTSKPIASGWVCPECTRIIPRDNGSETPVKGILGYEQPPACTSEIISQVEDQEEEEGDHYDERQLTKGQDTGLRDEIRILRSELVSFRTEFRFFREAITTINDRLDQFDQRVKAMEKRLLDSSVSSGTKALEEAVESLQLQLHERDQDTLANDVQVSNLPEEKGESPIHLVTIVGAKLGVKLDERDVVSAVRMGLPRDGGAARPLVVRLARRATRDELIRAARVRRGATTADLGLAGPPTRFYLNERLTKHNRGLFNQARERARAAGWRYVWTRDGRVCARQADGKPVARIRRDSDIADIFG